MDLFMLLMIITTLMGVFTLILAGYSSDSVIAMLMIIVTIMLFCSSAYFFNIREFNNDCLSKGGYPWNGRNGVNSCIKDK